MLPEIDGIEVMRRIREQSTVPILILSAKNEEADKIVGLGLGADDYIVKPFSLGELCARAKALIRRYMYYPEKEKLEDSILTHSGLTLHTENCSVTKNGQIIELTAKEYHILKCFMLNPKKVFTKAEIFEYVWGEDFFGDENTVMVHIRRLRKKIENDPNEPTYITTVWGLGYKLGEDK